MRRIAGETELHFLVFTSGSQTELLDEVMRCTNNPRIDGQLMCSWIWVFRPEYEPMRAARGAAGLDGESCSLRLLHLLVSFAPKRRWRPASKFDEVEVDGLRPESGAGM